ncbi:hypothetical protein BV22DRAFT_1108425 [Leucogyrophana mollusca]|uniref:Uncharacterized protein n=1 Tax=Leucogyrophana mollusca TaxID=85980 RepID=A0ACB8AXT0_9AGAM|nr:hypothetical protein BV22DRAFT_1108425 [Leucogyrophana mollusca]
MLEIKLTTIKSTHQLSDDDFVRFFAEEKAYLEGLQQPPPQEHWKIRYVSVLDEIAACRTEWDLARDTANNALNTAPVGHGFNEIHTILLQTRRRVGTAYAKMQNMVALAAHAELQLGINQRWEINGPEYSYKLRQQIGKALQRCSQAIRNAITQYNTKAVALNPPHLTISWKEIADYTFLGEFDLL